MSGLVDILRRENTNYLVHFIRLQIIRIQTDIHTTKRRSHAAAVLMPIAVQRTTMTTVPFGYRKMKQSDPVAGASIWVLMADHLIWGIFDQTSHSTNRRVAKLIRRDQLTIVIAVNQNLLPVQPHHELHRLIWFTESEITQQIGQVVVRNHRVMSLDDRLVHRIEICLIVLDEFSSRPRAKLYDITVPENDGRKR